MPSSIPKIFKDIKHIASWGSTPLGTHTPPEGPGQRMVVLIKGDLLRKYPNTEIFLQKAEWKDEERKNRGPVTVIDDSTLRRPLFSAQIDPDYKFVGFDLAPNDALGDDIEPGWFFVLKERADIFILGSILTPVPLILPGRYSTIQQKIIA